jgi:hypothetical protein
VKDFKSWFVEKHGYYPMREHDPIAAGLALLLDEMSVWATAMLEQAAQIARAEADQVEISTVVEASEGKK